jgi:hypothetical protein
MEGLSVYSLLGGIALGRVFILTLLDFISFVLEDSWRKSKIPFLEFVLDIVTLIFVFIALGK